jgi:hypothetical protein
MIKVINILLIMALLVPKIAFGDELDGYFWARMDESNKYLLMAGYINGFWLGTVHGADFGVNTASKYLKDLSSSSVYGVKLFKDYWKCGTNIDNNRETILNAAGKYAKNSLNQSTGYYVDDVDSFYKQYPLCRRKDFMEMLANISLVWLNIRTYKDIGEECSKN